MKIILMSVGTRGDMEPFLAIGEILKEKGHHVICAFPEQFRNLALESNFEFASLGSKLIELLESDIGKAAMGSGGPAIKKILAIVNLARTQTASQKELMQKQFELVERENPDRIVHNAKSMYPIIWNLKNKRKTILVSPVPFLHYVKGNTHVAFNSNFGSFLNKATFSIANLGLVSAIKNSIKWLKLQSKISRKEISQVLQSQDVIYTISPTLFPRPSYWKDNMKVLGYHERNKTLNWTPDRDLTNFMDKHSRLLMVTFGSMTNPEPLNKTEIIVDILQRNKIPAIINTASGGLVKIENYNSDLLHFVSNIPYEWILPKIYAMIHHGGAGTTHMTLKYGCATMIVPHIVDQFVWNKLIYKMGAGPKGIKIGALTVEKLEPKILQLISNRSFKQNAEQLASQMGKEEFKEDIYESIVKN